MEIELPSREYVFSMGESEGDVATYDPKTSKVTGKTLGTAHITVKDQNWDEELEEQSSSLMAKVHVAQVRQQEKRVFWSRFTQNRLNS